LLYDFFIFTKIKINRYYISTVKRNQVTSLQFYSYLLSIRDKTFSLIHYGRKLFHQYVVDAYTKIEANRINFIKQNQKELRADLYSGLTDFIKESLNGVIEKIGKTFVLPSTFKVNYFHLSIFIVLIYLIILSRAPLEI